MVEWNITQRLMGAFPDSFINGNGEFIAHRESNEYFILRNCETEFDVKVQGAGMALPCGTQNGAVWGS